MLKVTLVSWLWSTWILTIVLWSEYNGTCWWHQILLKVFTVKTFLVAKQLFHKVCLPDISLSDIYLLVFFLPRPLPTRTLTYQDIWLPQTSPYQDVSLPRHLPTKTFAYFRHFPTMTFTHLDFYLPQTFYYQDVYLPRHPPTSDPFLPGLFPTWSILC